MTEIFFYDMQPIFAALGFDATGGEFIYARKDSLDSTTNLHIVRGLHNLERPLVLLSKDYGAVLQRKNRNREIWRQNSQTVWQRKVHHNKKMRRHNANRARRGSSSSIVTLSSPTFWDSLFSCSTSTREKGGAKQLY